MAFTSLTFIFIFFPSSIMGYYLIYFLEKKWEGLKRYRVSDVLLVLMSLAFYGWACFDNMYQILIYVLCVWICGFLINVIKKGNSARWIVTGGILLCTGLLFYFKYCDFSLEILHQLFGMNISETGIIPPLGISFITFSALSYLIDVYRGDAEPGGFLDTALYLTFFPKIVSGPIVLYKDYQKQEKSRSVSLEKFISGLNRIIIGFAKKVILADQFGALVMTVQRDSAYGIDKITAWGAALVYMLEIYYDFSAYSDIALGLSEIFGFKFKENFNFPYISTSIKEFWRRWHISLGTWFREYIYIPLGGNRKGKARTLLNTWIVFAVTGLWHGAGWNYILWGLLHGTTNVIETCVQNKKLYQRIPMAVKWFGTMFIACIGWQLFRLEDMTELVKYFEILFGKLPVQTINYTYLYYFDHAMIFYIAIAILGATLLCQLRNRGLRLKIEKSAVLFMIQEVVLFALFILAIMYLVNSTYSPFIYFQY